PTYRQRLMETGQRKEAGGRRSKEDDRWFLKNSGRWGPYRQASPPPARHRPGARSARQGECPISPRTTSPNETNMFLQHLWQRLNRPATGTRVRSTPRPRSRLTVERLEDRAVPASFTASTVAELIADINGANLTAEADTITLAPGKTFTLTAVNNGTTGLPSVAASGGPLTIVGNGDVIERSTTKKTPAFRLIEVAAGASLTLENLTLQGGYLIGGSYDDFYGVGAAQGAAVYNAGSLAMTGGTVQNNTAYGGDGGWMGGFAEGGGIYSRGALTVQGGTIRNNLAVGGQGGEGLDGGWAFGGGI